MAGWFADTAGGRRQLGGNSMQKNKHASTYEKKFGMGIKFSYSYGKHIEKHFHRDQNDLKKLITHQLAPGQAKAFSESTFAKTMKGSADASFHASVTLGGSTSLYGGVRFQTNPLQGTGGVTLDSKIKSVLYLSLEFDANLHVKGQVASNAPITPTWKTKAALFAFFVGVKIKHHIIVSVQDTMTTSCCHDCGRPWRRYRSSSRLSWCLCLVAVCPFWWISILSHGSGCVTVHPPRYEPVKPLQIPPDSPKQTPLS